MLCFTFGCFMSPFSRPGDPVKFFCLFSFFKCCHGCNPSSLGPFRSSLNGNDRISSFVAQWNQNQHLCALNVQRAVPVQMLVVRRIRSDTITDELRASLAFQVASLESGGVKTRDSSGWKCNPVSVCILFWVTAIMWLSSKSFISLISASWVQGD